MIAPEEEVKLYRLLEDRLEKLAASVGYWEQPADSDQYKSLEEAWTSYLDGLGVRIVPKGFQPKEDVYMSSDPLYTTGDLLLFSWDMVEKILVVGLP